MDFELECFEQSVLPSRLNVPPFPPVMHFEKTIYFQFLNQLVYIIKGIHYFDSSQK